MKFIPFKEAKVSKWSGGETIELFISPEEADFKSGDYDLRISVATVNLQESVYTKLPGVWRTLMLLEGNLELNHEGHHTSVLKPFEQDSFSGEWTTHSKGVVKNFNVMTKKGKAVVEHRTVDKGETMSFEEQADNGILFYCKWKRNLGRTASK